MFNLDVKILPKFIESFKKIILKKIILYILFFMTNIDTIAIKNNIKSNLNDLSSFLNIF